MLIYILVINVLKLYIYKEAGRVFLQDLAMEAET